MADNAMRTESGVEALVARLRDDGVAAGRAEAERLLRDAEAKARRLIEEAEAEARAKREAARKEAEAYRRAGEDALRAAARDTVLDVKEQLARRFAEDVGKTVSRTMLDQDLLHRMILAVAGRAREEGAVDSSESVEILLPRSAVGLDDLRRDPEELREGTLSHFAAAAAAEMLRAGVTFGRADDAAEGIRLVLEDRGVSIDLTDRAVADAILVHLQPRFRALLEGVVK
jgi:V/A-type H+/Na+-transporting ATPase subunit E